MAAAMVEGGTLGYIFACLFLFFSLAYYTLYSSMFIARLITYAVNRFFLSQQQHFYLGSIAFSPLHSRLMLKNVHFFDTNLGIRVCDMYVTFKYWGRLFKDDGWRTPNSSEKLNKGIGVRFKRRKEEVFTHGIVVSGAVAEEKVVIQVVTADGVYETERIHRRALQLRNCPGRLKVHVNGLEVFAYNNYYAYEALCNLHTMRDADNEEAEHEEIQLHEKLNVPSHHSAHEPLLRKRQVTSFEKSMNFLRKIEFDVRTACVSLGCTSASMPYFLNASLSECFGSYFLTGGDFLGEDLYRQVSDFLIYTLGVRFVPVEKALNIEMPSLPPRPALTTDRFKKLRSNFVDAANLFISGDQSYVDDNTSVDERERTTAENVVVDPKDLASLHVTWYKDEPGLERGKRKTHTAKGLPRVGLVIEIDSKRVSYGPFADITRKILMEHFFPQTFRPQKLQHKVIGAPRPHGSFEVRIDFVNDCDVSVPFSHKTDSPSLPFGTMDSGDSGKLQMSIEKGSMGIFRFPFLLDPKTEMILVENYLYLKNTKVVTSLNDSCFLQSPAVEIHLDFHVPQLYEEQRRMDTSVSIGGGEIWFLHDHIRFFQDLLADFSHGKINYYDSSIESSWSYAHFFSDFVPQVAQFEIFFTEPTKLFLNVNENNIIYSTDHCSLRENSLLEAKFARGEVRLCNDYHGYTIFKENEQKTHFQGFLKNMHFRFSPSKYHSVDVEKEPFLQTNELSLSGYYSAMLPNMSQSLQEFEKQQTQTNLSSGPAKFANVLRLGLSFGDVTASLRAHHLDVVHNLKCNYIGEESSHVSPSEFSYFQHNGKNIKSCMSKFLTRNDFRRNDLESVIDVAVRGYSGEFHLGKPTTSDPLRVCFHGENILYTMRSSVKLVEHQLCLSPIAIHLRKEGENGIDGDNTFLMLQGADVSYTQLLGAYPMQLAYQATLRCEVGDATLKMDVFALALLMENLRETRWSNIDSKIHDVSVKSKDRPRSRRKLDSTLFQLKHAFVEKLNVSNPVQSSYLNPYEDLSIINHFREWYAQRAEKVQEAASLCYTLVQGSIRHVTTSLRTSDGDFRTVLSFPHGIHAGYTTLHDGNTDSRWSVAAPALDARLLAQSPGTKNKVDHRWREILTFHSALFLRGSKSVSLNSDSGLNQFTKQRTFMAANHMYYDFNRSNDHAGSSARHHTGKLPGSARRARKDRTSAHSKRVSSKDARSNAHETEPSRRAEPGKTRPSAPEGVEEHHSNPSSHRTWKETSAAIEPEENLSCQVKYTCNTPFVRFSESKHHTRPRKNKSVESAHKFMISALVPNNEHRGRNNISTVCYSVGFSRKVSVHVTAELPKCLALALQALQEDWKRAKGDRVQQADAESDVDMASVSSVGDADYVKRPAEQQRRTNVIFFLNAPSVVVDAYFSHTLHEHSVVLYHNQVTIRDFCVLYSAEREDFFASALQQNLAGVIRFSTLELTCSEVHLNDERHISSVKEHSSQNRREDEETAVFSLVCDDLQVRAKTFKLFSKKHAAQTCLPIIVTLGSVSCALTDRSALALVALARYTTSPLQGKSESPSASPGGNPFLTRLGVNLEVRTHLQKVHLSHAPRGSQGHGSRQLASTAAAVELIDMEFFYDDSLESMIAVMSGQVLRARLYPDIFSLLASVRALRTTERDQPAASMAIRFQCSLATCNVKAKSRQGDYLKFFASQIHSVYSVKSDSGDARQLMEHLFSAERLEVYYVVVDQQSVSIDSRHDPKGTQILNSAVTNLVMSAVPSARWGLASSLGWTSFEFEMPYRRDMMELIIPMFREFIHQWMSAIARTSETVVDVSGQKKESQNALLQCDLGKIEFKARLANDTEVKFSITKLSGILSKIFSRRRLRFYAADISVSTVDSSFGLPNVYFYQSHDTTHMTKSNVIIIDRWTANITSEIFAHCLEIFRRFGVDLIEFVTPLLIQGSAEITRTKHRAELWKLFFVGLDVSIQSAFAALTIKMGEINFGLLRSARPELVRWTFAMPIVRVMLTDQLHIERYHFDSYESLDADESSSNEQPEEELSGDNARYSSSDRESKPKIEPQREKIEAKAGHNQFTWLQTTTSFHGSNFDGPSLESETAFDVGYWDGTRHSGDGNSTSPETDNLSDAGTQVLHARLEVPAVQTLLRPGSLKVLLEFFNEYKAQWVEIEQDIQRERQVTRERLKENPLYKGSQVSMMNVLHSLMTTLSPQHSTAHDQLEREWLLITSIFVSRISFVIAFGDDLYNRVRSKSLRYVCEHKNPADHTYACVNEDFSYPLFTSKLYIDSLKFVDSVQFTSSSHGEFYNRVFHLEGKMIYLYIRDESAGENTQSFDNLLRSRNANEFFGTAKGTEFSKSSNRVHVPSFSIKGKTNAQKQSKESSASLCVAGPLIYINMRLFFYIRDIQAEFSPFVSFRGSKPTSDKPKRAGHARYFVDIAPGELHVTSCVALPAYFSSPAEAHKPKSAFARLAGAHSKRTDSKGSGQAHDGTSDRSVFDMTTPSITALLRTTQDGHTEISHSSHIDVFLSQIKINPAIVVLSTEYAFLESRWSEEKHKKNVTLNSKQKSHRLAHLLSFPHALLVHALSDVAGPSAHFEPLEVEERETLPTENPPVYNIHVSIIPFKFIVSADPFSATCVAFSIEENGSLDILLRSKGNETTIGVVCKKIRGEVQTRMEVNSIEVFVPSLIADIVLTEQHTVVHVNLLEELKEGIDLMYRLTHISQWYLMAQLWSAKLQQARKLSADLCNRDIQGKASESPSLRSCDLSVDRKSFNLIVNMDKIGSSFVIGQTSKYDVTLGRTSAFYSAEYVNAVDCIRALLYGESAATLDFILADINIFCEGHATGCVFSDKTIYCQLRVYDPIERHISEAMRKARIVVPHFHAALRERQLAEALQMDLINMNLHFEDEEIIDASKLYNMFIESTVDQAYVFLSTALVSMVKSIQSEVSGTLTVQQEIVRKFLEKISLHPQRQMDIKRSTASGEHFIPFLGSNIIVPPNGQILCSIKDFALTVGESTPSQSSNVLLLAMDAFMAEFAQVREFERIQKACCIDVQNWNIFRTSTDQRSLIIGSSGANMLQLETTQVIGSPSVEYSFDSNFDQPWQGSPQIVDFELIARIVKTFAALSSQSPNAATVQDVRQYTTISPGTFAPELRVTSDVVVNIDTLLNWAGMQQDTLPKHMHSLITDLLENLLSALYKGLCPPSVLRHEKSLIQEILEKQSSSKRTTKNIDV